MVNLFFYLFFSVWSGGRPCLRVCLAGCRMHCPGNLCTCLPVNGTHWRLFLRLCDANFETPLNASSAWQYSRVLPLSTRDYELLACKVRYMVRV